MLLTIYDLNRHITLYLFLIHIAPLNLLFLLTSYSLIIHFPPHDFWEDLSIVLHILTSFTLFQSQEQRDSISNS